jgi:hypothetical protein
MVGHTGFTVSGRYILWLMVQSLCIRQDIPLPIQQLHLLDL